MDVSGLSVRLSLESATFYTEAEKAKRSFQSLQQSIAKDGAAISRSTDSITANFTRSAGGMKNALGQVSLQLQDVIVQLQSGTRFSTVFAQQGTQIASAFGPVGAIVGAAGAAIVAAGSAILGFNSAGEATKPILDDIVTKLNSGADAARKYGAALTGATEQQLAFIQAAAAQGAASTRGQVSGTRKEVIQQLIDEFRSVPRSQRTTDYSTAREGLKATSGSLAAAIDAGKPEEVRRILKESGIIQTPAGLAIAEQAVQLAASIQTYNEVISGEAALMEKLRGQSGPANNRGSGSILGYDPARLTQQDLAEVEQGAKTEQKVVTKAFSEAEQERLRIAKEAAAAREAQRKAELDSILVAYREDERVAKAVEAEKVRAAADAQREAERIAQQQMDTFLEPIKEAGRQIQNIFADAIYQGLNGEIQTVKEFFNTFKQIALQSVSQIAAASILSPTFLFGGGGAVAGAAPVAGAGAGGIGGFGSLLGAGAFLGGGGATLASTFPSVFGAGGASLTALGGGSGAGALAGFGGASLAGIAGAAGLGILGGSIIAPMVGLNATGGGLGAGLGAGLGFIAGGPIGAVAGGVLGGVGGGLLGNFFGGGGGERNNNYRASFVDGQFVGVSNTKPDQQNVDAITGVQQQIAALYQIIQQGGGSFEGTLGFNAGNRDGLQLTTAGGTRNFGSTSALSLAAARALIAGSEGVSALDRRIAGRSQATDAAGLAEDLQFARQFQELTGAVTPFVAELKNLLREFEKQDEKAKELGLSLKDLNAAQARQLQTIREQKTAQIASLQGGFRSTVDGAFGFLDPIQQLRDSFSTSGGTARSRFGSAQSEFERVRRQVEAGRLEGFNGLTGAAQNLLGAARENFASGTGYAQIREMVQQVLDSALEQGADAQDPLLDGIGKNTATIQGLRDELLKERDDVVEQLKALRREIRALDRAA